MAVLNVEFGMRNAELRVASLKHIVPNGEREEGLQMLALFEEKGRRVLLVRNCPLMK